MAGNHFNRGGQAHLRQRSLLFLVLLLFLVRATLAAAMEPRVLAGSWSRAEIVCNDGFDAIVRQLLFRLQPVKNDFRLK